MAAPWKRDRRKSETEKSASWKWADRSTVRLVWYGPIRNLTTYTGSAEYQGHDARREDGVCRRRLCRLRRRDLGGPGAHGRHGRVRGADEAVQPAPVSRDPFGPEEGLGRRGHDAGHVSRGVAQSLSIRGTRAVRDLVAQ